MTVPYRSYLNYTDPVVMWQCIVPCLWCEQLLSFLLLCFHTLRSLSTLAQSESLWASDTIGPDGGEAAGASAVIKLFLLEPTLPAAASMAPRFSLSRSSLLASLSALMPSRVARKSSGLRGGFWTGSAGSGPEGISSVSCHVYTMGTLLLSWHTHEQC